MRSISASLSRPLSALMVTLSFLPVPLSWAATLRMLLASTYRQIKYNPAVMSMSMLGCTGQLQDMCIYAHTLHIPFKLNCRAYKH